MHGLKPTDLAALRQLEGAALTQICLGPHDIQFNFAPRGNVSVQSRCELRDDGGGALLDAWEGRTAAGPFRFAELIGATVRAAAIDGPRSFVLRFGNALALRVVDTFDEYESFSVGGLYV